MSTSERPTADTVAAGIAAVGVLPVEVAAEGTAAVRLTAPDATVVRTPGSDVVSADLGTVVARRIG